MGKCSRHIQKREEIDRKKKNESKGVGAEPNTGTPDMQISRKKTRIHNAVGTGGGKRIIKKRKYKEDMKKKFIFIH